MSPRDRALEWWRERIDTNRYVLDAAERPPSAVARFLRGAGYVAEVAGGKVWILKTPDRTDLRELCLSNYWPVIGLILDQYGPAIVERASAVRLHLEDFTPPSMLTVRHGSSQSRYTIDLCPGFKLRLTPGSVEPARSVTRSAMGVEIPVDSPEETLLRLPLSVLRDNLDEVAVWLRTLVLSRPALEAVYAEKPRPLVVKRFSHLATEVGNSRLAGQLEALLAGEYQHRIGRGQTGVGGAIIVPAHVTALPTTHSAWLDHHAATLSQFYDRIGTATAETDRGLLSLPLSDLLEQAREAKSYDAYHSTTIEGYRITPEEVSAVLRNEPVEGNAPDRVRSRMAVAGYGQAFERCLDVLRESGGSVHFSEALVGDLHVDLFAPSIDAGIVSVYDLQGYRTSPAFLRGFAQVPPGPEKVPALMQQFIEFVNKIERRAVLRAVLAHLDFVTIRPYSDGNGRIARLLMNLALLGEGHPWVTIRADDRAAYFKSLEAAQIGRDPVPFANFICAYIRRDVRAG